VISLNLSVLLSGAAGKPDTLIDGSQSRSPGRSPCLWPPNPRGSRRCPVAAPALPGNVRAAGCAPQNHQASPPRSGRAQPSRACPFSGACSIYSLSGDGAWGDWAW